MKKIKVYDVFDDDCSVVMGINQLKEFAITQVIYNQDDFIEDNLECLFDDWKTIVNLANKIINEDYKIQTLKEACLILKVRSYQIEEIEVY